LPCLKASRFLSKATSSWFSRRGVLATPDTGPASDNNPAPTTEARTVALLRGKAGIGSTIDLGGEMLSEVRRKPLLLKAQICERSVSIR
jgi:hypothetical protein